MVLRLADGTHLDLSKAEARELVSRLWAIVPLRGALTAAGRIRDACDITVFSNPNVPLDALESAAVRAACADFPKSPMR